MTTTLTIETTEIDRSLRYAAECRKLADQAWTAEEKAEWLSRAARFQRTAEILDRIGE